MRFSTREITYARLDNTAVGDKVFINRYGEVEECVVKKITSRTMQVKGNILGDNVLYYNAYICGGCFRDRFGYNAYKETK